MNSPAKAACALADALGAREHVTVKVPRTEVTGRMRVIGRSEALEVMAEMRALFSRLKLLDDQGRIFGAAFDDWKAEIAVRHLAVAVRDPADESKPLAPLEKWREYSDEQIGALWSEYQDLRDRLDPLCDAAAPLSSNEVLVMSEAVKKKESAVLMSYGSRKLASFLLSSAEQPAISPTPK